MEVVEEVLPRLLSFGHETSQVAASTAKLLNPFPCEASFEIDSADVGSTDPSSKQDSHSTAKGSLASDWPFLPCYFGSKTLVDSYSCCSLPDDRPCCC